MKDKQKKRQEKRSLSEKEVTETIRSNGRSVLSSEVFRRAKEETHHLHGSISDHTLNVCITGTRIGRFLQKKGIRINEKDLVQAALCHDLGMVERGIKYKNRKDSWKYHPEESVKIACEIVPDLSAEAQKMIRTHMWPMHGRHPGSREELILNLSDKYASLVDWISWAAGKKYKARIKKRLTND